MLFQNHLNWLSKACAIVALCFSPIVLSAQIVIYSEDFESETPVNTEDLCDPVYTPADASWALGPACSVPTNGIPKLVDVAGDVFLEFNQQYPSGSEVWNSAGIDVSAVSSTIVSFDARSVGGHENAGTFQDEFALYVVRGGVQDASPIVSFAGHVDGSGNGSPQTEEESFSSVVDVAGDSQIALRIVVGISGSDGSESYQLNNFSVCDDANGDGECTACDEPIALLDSNTNLEYDLSDQQVQCESDLPNNCAPEVVANRGDVQCFQVAEGRNAVLPSSANSAVANIGVTAAIKLFGLGTDPTDDRNLVPSGDGLFYYESAESFWVYGHVEDVDDPNFVYQVSYKYAEGVTGAEWRAMQGANGANAFKHDQGCTITADEEDAWQIYLMDTASTSFIVGDGTYLTLNHAPTDNPNTGLPLWGFQVGAKANNTNCSELGASAWFNYTGSLDGSAIAGGFGDLLLDLDAPRRGDPCVDSNCDGELTESERLNAIQNVFVYTVVDSDCGDLEEFTQYVYAWDTIAPVLSDTPADTTVTCYDLVPTQPTITAEDNCVGVVPVTYTELVYDSAGAGCFSIDRIWLAQDSCGANEGCNIVTYTQTITVADNISPELALNCPADFTIYADANCAIDTTTTATGMASTISSDNCLLVDSSLTYSDQVTEFTAASCYTFERTWTATATDDCGNVFMDYCIQTIMVMDVIKPSIDLSCPANTTVHVAADCTADLSTANTGDITLSFDDNCALLTSSSSYVDDVTDSTSTGCYTIERTWTANAVDACGNDSTTTCTQTIMVMDSIKPSIDLTCPQDITVYVDADCTVDLSTSSTGDITVIYDDYCLFTSEDSYNDVITDSTSTGCYTIERTWTANAADHCGNDSTTTCTQTITVMDNIKPSIDLTCPQDTTVYVDADCAVDLSTSSTGDITVTYDDNCLFTSEDSYNDVITDSTSTGCYTIERTWTANATDECGNDSTTTCTQTIMVMDNIKPDVTLTCPTDTTVYVDETCGVDLDPSSTGDITVIYDDNCVFTSEDSYNDVVIDSTGTGCYTFERTWTAIATDDCGNDSTATCTQTITVSDTLAPTWDAYDIYLFASCDEILDPTDPTLIPISATDNCSGVRYEIEAHQLSGGCPGTWMRLWTAIDSCGNRSIEAQQYIQQWDSLAPALTLDCPADISLEVDAACEAGTDTSITGAPDYTVIDNCDASATYAISYSDDDTTALCGNTYQFIRTWQLVAEDVCENKDTLKCDQTITLIDTISPIVTAAADTTVECDGMGNADAIQAWLDNNGGATASDNCSGITWSNNYSDCGDGADTFNTYRQGTWGSDNSNTASDLLDADFATVFPSGLTVGCGAGFKLDFTNAASVDNYLPCTGSAQDLVLTHGGTNPTEEAIDPTCWNNALVSHLLTAKLNVAFDAADPAFSPSDVALGDLVILQGAFLGKTVNEVIEISDGVLGDCRGDYSPQQCRVALRAFNKNYAPASTDRGFVHTAGCLSDDCGSTGIAIVTFTATDDCDNTSSTTAIFTIEDTTAPEMTALPLLEVYCGDWDCNIDSLTAVNAVSAEDVCGGVTLAVDSCKEMSFGCLGGYDVYYSATDDCGNKSTTTQIIQIIDTVAPIIIVTAQDTTTECDGSGNLDELNAWLANNAGASAFDECNDAEDLDWSNDYAALTPDCGATGSVTVTFTVMDCSDNSSTTTATFTIQDTTDPTITVEAENDTVECDGAGNSAALTAWLADNAGAEATDVCSGPVIWSNDFDALSDLCGATGESEVTFTATDSCGNASTTMARFVIEDTTAPDAPTIICPNDTTIYLDANCAVDTTSGALGLASSSASDVCDSDPSMDEYYIDSELTYTCVTASQPVPVDTWDGEGVYLDLMSYSGEVTITFTITEESGIFHSIIVPEVGTFEENDGTVTLELTGGQIYGPCDAPNGTLYIGSEIPTDSPQASGGIQLLLVEEGGDDWNDMVVVIDEGQWSRFNEQPTVASQPIGDGNVEGSYTFTRTFYAAATDACELTGDTSNCAQIITVLDTLSPVLTAALDETVECDGSGNTAELAAWLADNGGATGTDNCDSELTWTNNYDASNFADSCGATGTVSVTFTAADDCNNMSTTTATFIIEDTTDPTITVEAENDTVECDGAGNAAALAAWLADNGGAEATDACSGPVIWSNDHVALSDLCGATGESEVTFTATDSCGNASTTMARFVIEDTTAPDAPTMICPNDTTIYLDANCAVDTTSGTLGLASSSASDVCDSNPTLDEYYSDSELVYTCTGDDTDLQGSYSFTRTFYAAATDACGLTGDTSNCAQIITVLDTLAPVLTADSVYTISCELYDPSTLYAVTAADNCDGDASITIDSSTEQSGACPATYLRVYKAIDDCGNYSTIEQVVNVIDTVAPELTITCPSDTTLYLNATCDADTTTGSIGEAATTLSDNCDNTPNLVVTYSDVVTPGCGSEYTVVRTWMAVAKDTCNNTTEKSCVQNITVRDTIAPMVTLTCPAPAIVEALESCYADTDSSATGGPAFSTSDNCYVDSDTLYFSDAVVDSVSAGCYSIERTWTVTATDGCGNSTTETCMQTITVEDNTKPSLTVTGMDSIQLYTDANCFVDTSYATVGGLIYTASDNCTMDTLIVEYSDSQAVLTCSDTDSALEGSYSFTRSFTVTASDECGNDSVVMYAQVVEVIDSLAPQFTNTCDFSNGGTEYDCCTSLNGEVDWETSLACDDIAVADNCDSEVSLTLLDTFDGQYAPTDEVLSFCQSSIPEAFESGETCTGHDPHNLRLFSLPGIGTEMYADVTGSGLISNNVDGTWSLTQEVMSIDGSGGGWIIEMTYSAAMDWDEWQAQPGAHTYKLDCGNIGDDHENWDYRILEEGSLIGTGTYAGDSLQAFHAPTNELFGLQVGLGGSGQNANYGYGAWMYYSGQFQSQQINGTGDIFGDLDCCLPWSVTRTYTAVDDCENSSSFSYTLSVNDEEMCDDFSDGEAELGGGVIGDHTPVVLGGSGDLTTGKTPIRVTNLQPNPTNDWSLLGFTVTENMRLRVDMVAMDGTLIAELYDGIASPNVNHTLDIEANDLDAGMYQIRLSSAQYLVVKKLLVSQ